MTRTSGISALRSRLSHWMRRPGGGSLVGRFAVLSFITIVVIATLLGWRVTGALTDNMLSRAEQITASVVTHAVGQEFTADDFLSPGVEDRYEALTEIVEQLTLGPDVVRVKIWDGDGTVLWSDERELVGQHFPDKEEIPLALAGEPVSELSTLDGEEHLFDHDFHRLLELYVPITFPGQAGPSVIFEVYQSVDSLYADAARHNRAVWTYIGAGFGVLFLVLFGIVRGASNRIQRQTDEITRSHESYRDLVQTAQDGIISVDREGRIILFNRMAENIFGYEACEVIGQGLEPLVPDRFRERHRAALARYRANGIGQLVGTTVEMEGRRKNGEVFALELSLGASGEDQKALATGIVRDVSERKAMQARLMDAERQATVSVIAGSIGHELKNTVFVLSSYSELLRDDPQDARLAAESAYVFGSQAERLASHAANLGSISKPRQPEMKPVDLSASLDGVTEMLRTSGILKAYEITKSHDERLPTVLADEMLLEQVIRNLEINASHAMGSHGTLAISTRLSDDGQYGEFCISDTGSGIPADRRGQIFLPFFTTKKEEGGTGLGMYIVRQVVDQHQGYINLASEEGAGTSITIGLPLSHTPAQVPASVLG